MRKWLIGFADLGAAVAAAWVFKGRFAVEGGRRERS